MDFKCAFLGCGPRSKGHARAYQHITRGRAVACCDLDPERLQAHADEFAIASRYTDLDEMLDKEKPDLVHLVTPPNLRVGLMAKLSEAGVPGVLVEKPICVGADDYKRLRRLEQTSRTRFAVNHQLRYHPRVLYLLDRVRSGAIGEVRFLDASSALPMSGQGVHVLDLMCAFAGYPEVETVFGVSAEYLLLNGNHPGPRRAQSLITFKNGTRAALQAGEGAPMRDPTQRVHMHKRISVYGTLGMAQWWMQGWEITGPDRRLEQGSHVYGEEDALGQAALTNAMFDWLQDDAKPCATNLATSLDEWLVILAGYMSSIEARPVDFPFDPPDDLLGRLKAFTGGD